MICYCGVLLNVFIGFVAVNLLAQILLFKLLMLFISASFQVVLLWSCGIICADNLISDRSTTEEWVDYNIICLITTRHYQYWKQNHLVSYKRRWDYKEVKLKFNRKVMFQWETEFIIIAVRLIFILILRLTFDPWLTFRWFLAIVLQCNLRRIWLNGYAKREI